MNLAPTIQRRRWGGPDHQVPKAGLRDRTGHVWKGTQRVANHKAHRARLKPLTGDWRALLRENGLAAWRRARFEKMSRSQLIVECDKRGLTGSAKATKPELLGLLFKKCRILL